MLSSIKRDEGSLLSLPGCAGCSIQGRPSAVSPLLPVAQCDPRQDEPFPHPVHNWAVHTTSRRPRNSRLGHGLLEVGAHHFQGEARGRRSFPALSPEKLQPGRTDRQLLSGVHDLPEDTQC